MEEALRGLEPQIRTLEDKLKADEARAWSLQQAKKQAAQTREEGRRALSAARDCYSAKGEVERIEATRPERDLAACHKALDQAEQKHRAAQAAVSLARQEVDDQRRLEPGWLWRIFWPFKRTVWQKHFKQAKEDAAARADEEKETAAESDRAKKLLSVAKDWTSRHTAAAAALTAAANCVFAIWANVPPLKDVLTRSQTADQRSKEAEVAAKAALQALNLTKRSLSERRAEAGRLKTSKADIERNLRDLGVNQEMLDEWAPHRMDEKTKQTKAPWHDEALWVFRHKAFIAALNLHKSFLAANRDKVVGNLRSMVALLTGNLSRYWVGSEDLRALWSTLFLAIPVVSTTFASLGRVFAGLGKETLGWLIIDEAGQATPQAAVGGIWRARRTLVVGDPLQIEPVVTSSAVTNSGQTRPISAPWPTSCGKLKQLRSAPRFSPGVRALGLRCWRARRSTARPNSCRRTGGIDRCGTRRRPGPPLAIRAQFPPTPVNIAPAPEKHSRRHPRRFVSRSTRCTPRPPHYRFSPSDCYAAITAANRSTLGSAPRPGSARACGARSAATPVAATSTPTAAPAASAA